VVSTLAVVVTATTVEVTLVVIVFPLESVVVTGTTTGVAPAACLASLRRELMSASRDANWTEYWVGMALVNQEGMLVARSAE
jgi:hypothetical protein